MEDDLTSLTTLSPSTSPRRGRHRLSRRDSSNDELRTRIKSEMHLRKEFIDFDVIKGSAFFHTKPSNHDKKLVKEGFKRVLFVPFHAKFWKQKPWFYETATALYGLHFASIAIYFCFPDSISVFSGFELSFPIVLLVLVALAYGRVTSILQAGDSDPTLKLYSPTKHHGHSSPSRTSATAAAVAEAAAAARAAENATDSSSSSSIATALGSDIAESGESDGTDSDDESGSSSSSSDETAPDEQTSFASGTPRSMPTTPSGFPATPSTSRPHRFSDGVETFARRRVTVCVWEEGVPRKKSMTVTELRNTILAKVKATPSRMVYRKIAYFAAITLSLVPLATRCLVMCYDMQCLDLFRDPVDSLIWFVARGRYLSSPGFLMQQLSSISLGASIISLSYMLSTYQMAFVIFTALADAEVTYHRRLMYAKCFTALTSSRRSRINNLPHFRLKNVVNIKAWISLRGGRTWLKRQGRQRAADEIVSTSFLINMVLLVIMGVQAVSETSSGSNQPETLLRIEVTIWCLLSSIFMLRFMMLGSHINKKYQNTSLLLTEQMNVYLRLLVKPHKKEKLLVSNNVLKLASKLLKELNSPNKVSGLTMNPLLYNITRVIVLSAFSSTASEFFGFKLKLWKMKHF
ncbi:hypothetical protein Poli38472_003112 [Pythium oligandrum]|uniref:PHTF1/2 N-terminal domain-containing protein n=1 Tax=Pythium oligandrum TaxID=41045 RepID=A0A8K1C621_PYTOL|nr:hypothetical protein Poli38472_003112 [Pythium oligandrum]|eukprot:TMW57187.1 hypothetical protein Poli38472_003112 [Pythium oligandrum]